MRLLFYEAIKVRNCSNLGFPYLFGRAKEYWYPIIRDVTIVRPSLSKKQSECGIYCLRSFEQKNAIWMCSLRLFEYP